MSDPTTDLTNDALGDHVHATHLPAPIVKKMRWPFPLIWIVPVLAAALAGYYFFQRHQEQGPLITIKFADASGLRVGQSQLSHLGIGLGQVVGMQLSNDKRVVLVQVRVNRSNDAFARDGAKFWIVRPEISAQEITGLSTVLSGPFIDTLPGNGEVESDFNGLQSAPPSPEEGLRVVVKTRHVDHLQPGSAVFFRGIQVGTVEGTKLSEDASSVEINVFIRNRYKPLVKANTQFWVLSGVDVKGGLFSGIDVKVGSIRSLLSSGLGFATPQKNMGEQAKNGYEFLLNNEPQKEWLDWAPAIPISPDDTTPGSNGMGLPHAPSVIQSAVGS